jgi:DNA polymerase-3 subunit epsilon
VVIPFADVSFVVVDVETTGTSAGSGDRITELAAVTVEGGCVAPAYHSLVNPERPIPRFITALTGIDDAMVRRAPRFQDIAGEVAAQLAGRVFVAHNARFDWNFLASEFARVAPGALDGIALGQLCTVRLARRLLPNLPRRNLDAVCLHYGVEIEGRHRAMGDALATARILVALLRDAGRRDVRTMNALQTLLARRPAQTRRRAMPTWSDGVTGA